MAGFFSKERSLQRKLKKSQKKLLNMYAQTPERQYAAHTLAEIGSDDALAILLERFEKRTNNHTIDREEKKFIHDLLVDMGPAVVEHLTRHIRGPAEFINWPLRVLRRFVEENEIAELIVKRASAMQVREAAMAAGMVTLAQDGMKKVLRGQTTPEELTRIVFTAGSYQ